MTEHTRATLKELLASLQAHIQAHGGNTLLDSNMQEHRVLVFGADYSLKAIDYREFAPAACLLLGWPGPEAFLEAVRDIRSRDRYPVVVIGADGAQVLPVGVYKH